MADNAPESGAWVRFRNESEAIIAIGWNFFAPIAAVAITTFGAPVWAPGVLAIIPVIMSQVTGPGPAKKSEVMKITQIIMTTLEKELKGGAAGTYTRLEPFISATVDSLISTINQVYPAIIANDPPVTIPLPGPFTPAPVDSP